MRRYPPLRGAPREARGSTPAAERLTDSPAQNCPPIHIFIASGHTLKSVDGILERYLVRTRAMARAAIQKRLDGEERERNGDG